MTFTKGPWRFVKGEFNDDSQRDGAVGSIEGGDYWLAQIWQDFEAEDEGDARIGCPPIGTAIANARLIAAAPDLYEALKAIEAHHADLNARAGRNESRSKTLGMARAALAKADGGK